MVRERRTSDRLKPAQVQDPPQHAPNFGHGLAVVGAGNGVRAPELDERVAGVVELVGQGVALGDRSDRRGLGSLCLQVPVVDLGLNGRAELGLFDAELGQVGLEVVQHFSLQLFLGQRVLGGAVDQLCLEVGRSDRAVGYPGLDPGLDLSRLALGGVGGGLVVLLGKRQV